ncbi:MAG: nucleoside triphosphate pyrophosphohydrolase [Alphaproteobacteria bacterium]|nr:MAG: nucleoside triphosphate pyrophosphohydrolase [Alphaproteobacteria bacterium]
MTKLPNDFSEINALLEIMEQLRDPDTGCPWDVAQTFASIAPYTLEEAYEVADAIDRGDMTALKDELGDLLLQVVFHAQMAKQDGTFSFADVVDGICRKLVRRHPHVFGDGDADSPDTVRATWEEIKEAERQEKSAHGGPIGVLDDVPHALPALSRAVKLQDRAARVGFDWPEIRQVIHKLNEEMLELSTELAQTGNPQKVFEELGDLLFVYANLARHLKVDPEMALRGANAKFVRRFERIEQLLRAAGKTPQDSTLEEMDGLWTQAKLEERK